MSRGVSSTRCLDCGSSNATLEEFTDSEQGYIEECADCNYVVVYRADFKGTVIEDYKGWDHPYSGQLRLALNG